MEEFVEYTEVWSHDGNVAKKLLAVFVNGKPERVFDGVFVETMKMHPREVAHQLGL